MIADREDERGDETGHELAVTAKGLAQAAEILASQFTLVATNVPYLGRGKQDDRLKECSDRVYPEAKADLATCFVERCIDFSNSGGSTALVTSQNWLFLGTYKKLREQLLKTVQWNVVARLGSRAFETITGEVVNVALLTLTQSRPLTEQAFAGIDASAGKTPEEKATVVCSAAPILVSQKAQLGNPGTAVLLEAIDPITLIGRWAECFQGLSSTDVERFAVGFWELHEVSSRWRPFQCSPESTMPFCGREFLVDWETLQRGIEGSALRGAKAWQKVGVAIGQVRELPATFYTGELFADSAPVIIPRNPSIMPALWSFCSSPEFNLQLRRINAKLSVNNGYVSRVPFDLAHWQKVAAEKYPEGLPKPLSSDPTQWLFNGHPKGSDHPLQAAVARLLGYRWPRQTGSSFPDCPTLGTDGLEKFADSDGIVCISAIKGEEPAAERLRSLLVAAYGSEWSAAKQAELLAQGDYARKSLEDWLRNGFFEQHCALFHHRPFIWHIWDGRNDGFSALVNYHQLTKANLEKLTYSYLGDWIGRQKAAVAAGEAGSDARLQAAKELQGELQKILEGEPPYDIFVRWKGIEKQSIGWDPDLNDGVRLNIRPFMNAKDVGKKGAGILRAKPNIHWKKDRGTDVTSAPWFKVFKGERINDHHLTLDEKRKARAAHRT